MEALKVEERKKGTGGELNSLRKQGFIPGVIYGEKKPNILVYLPKKEFVSFLHKKTPLLSLEIGRNKESVIIKEKQIDPFRNDIIHIDFMRVSLKEKIEVKVGIKPIGIADGVKMEGILEQHIYKLNIKCPAENIPEAIDVSVEGLKIGEALYIKDIVVPQEIEILDDKDKIIFSIIPPRVEEVAEETKGVETTEPEVIKKRKKEEEIE